MTGDSAIDKSILIWQLFRELDPARQPYYQVEVERLTQ